MSGPMFLVPLVARPAPNARSTVITATMVATPVVVTNADRGRRGTPFKLIAVTAAICLNIGLFPRQGFDNAKPHRPQGGRQAAEKGQANRKQQSSQHDSLRCHGKAKGVSG